MFKNSILKKAIALFLFVGILLTFCSCEPAKSSSESALATSQEDISSLATGSGEENSSSETLAERNAKIVELRKLKWVAITIDDGPNEYYDYFLDELSKRNVNVTFFLLGENIAGYEDILTRMNEDGHEIGVHSYAHYDLSKLSSARVKEQLEGALAEIHRVLPEYTVKSMRAPGGQTSETVLEEAELLDWRVFGWSQLLDDKSGNSAADIVNTFCAENTVFNGDIFLLHLSSQTMVDVTLLLIDRLMEDGWTPVTISHLMERKAGGKAGQSYSGPVL